MKIDEGVANASNRLNQANQAFQEMQEVKRLKEQAKEERELELNNMIEQVVKNTSFIPEMVGLVRKNNEINEEVLELYKDMANVLKAETKDEAESKVLEIADKAKTTKDSLDTVTGLVNYGKVLIKLMFPEG
ncbi:hypothetical protein [Lentibacillus jeotgali]|uniref:hypothetical protein n=1 Tax=Lentibacillus jeotgali TaxID=558169 RepID=UPI0002625C76|nr:hypothetical protein [Lentibacillus jeotgali]